MCLSSCLVGQAIRVREPTKVARVAAAGALLSVPLGPWVEFRPRRPLMIRADLLRFLVLLIVPIAYGLGMLSYLQLLAVAVVVAVADIVFVGAGGAHLKVLVPEHHLTQANGRFETVRPRR
jgi:predicted MFS family arabinose efflux permease